eukprot:294090-Pleurochrysis_carterae.AAC.1
MISVVNCQDTTVSRSSRPRSPSGGWRLNTKYRDFSVEQANLTGTNGLSTSSIKLTKQAFPQGNIDPRRALFSHIQHMNVAAPTPTQPS